MSRPTDRDEATAQIERAYADLSGLLSAWAERHQMHALVLLLVQTGPDVLSAVASGSTLPLTHLQVAALHAGAVQERLLRAMHVEVQREEPAILAPEKKLILA